MVSEQDTREFVNAMSRGFAQLVLQLGGDTTAAMKAIEQILIDDPENMRREELAAILAFTLRRLHHKKSDLVKFSVN